MSALPDIPIESALPHPTKARRRQYLLLGGAATVVLAAFVAGVYLNDSSSRLAEVRTPVATHNYAGSTPGETVDPKAAWITESEAAMSSFKGEVQDDVKSVHEEVSGLREMVEKLLQRGNEGLAASGDNAEGASVERATRASGNGLPSLTTPLPPPPRAGASTSSVASTANRPEQLPRLPGRKAGSVPTEATSSGASAEEVAPAAPALPAPPPTIARVQFTYTDEAAAPHIRDTIPPGAFTRAVLLTGLYAPTGELARSNPHPVNLQILDDGNLPNHFRHRMQECRVTAAGHGSLADERAYLRLERLSCVLRNGELITVPIKGFVTGEDGANGLAGLLVEKQGALLWRSFLAGTLSGLGQAVSQSYSTLLTSPQGAVQTVDPNRVGEYGLASGFAKSMDKLAEWYLRRADETFPVIQIDAGRVVTINTTEEVRLGKKLLAEHTPPQHPEVP